jgi:spermidine synthase
MYNVVATGSIVIILYFLSLFFCRAGYFSLQVQRKIWNLLLAAFFISSAATGLFLALQINYKWNIPVIKSILKWHVESGIGLAFTGAIHFILHLSYFRKIFEPQAALSPPLPLKVISGKSMGENLFITGFTSSSVQLLLIREMMNISGGYEFITGIFLGSWLTGSALGASLAGKSKLNDIGMINLIFALSPVVSIFLMIILTRFYFSSGVTPTFLESIIFTFIVLTPYCMVSGFSFVKLISIAGSSDVLRPGVSFSIETTGGMAAGILISVLASGLLNTYQLLLIILSLCVYYVAIVYYLSGTGLKILLSGILFVGIFLTLLFNPDTFFRKQLLKGVKVTDTRDTPYGNITRGIYAGEESLYYNQRLLAYKNDEAEREEDIHYAMLQSNSPRNVLMISGDINSRLPEILKYPVKKVVFVERDPVLAGIASRNGSNRKLTIMTTDAYKYIRNTTDTFDVIILLLPPPSTLILNRYYTTDFFSEVKSRMRGNGIFMCSPGTETGYLNKEVLFLYSSIYNSMAGIFKNVLPMAGKKLYFIGSDSKLSPSVCQLSMEKNIQNLYVSPDYLSDDLIAMKSNEISSLIDMRVRQNRALVPVACFHYQAFSLSRYSGEKTIAIILLFIAFALPSMAVKRKNMIMYAMAASLAGFEIIALLLLQLTAGNMYVMTGLIIAGLMAGLAAGAGTNSGIMEKTPLYARALISIAYYIIIGLFAGDIIRISSTPAVIIIILLISFIPALFTGSLFGFLTSGQGPAEISSVYSSDLTGSALGFFLMSGVAIPLLGITVSVFLLSGIIFAGYILGTIGNKY